MGKIVVIVGILLLVGGGIYLRMRSQGTAPTSPVVSLPTASAPQQPATSSSDKKVEETPLDLPPLFPEASWKEEGAGTSPMEVISVDGNGKKLSGNLWSYAENFATMEAFNSGGKGGEIFSYYNDTFSKDGWIDKITAGGHTITAIRADGGGASLMSYIRSEGKGFRVFSLLTQTSFAKGEFPVDAQCPCASTYRVFVSDLLSPSDLLKK